MGAGPAGGRGDPAQHLLAGRQGVSATPWYNMNNNVILPEYNKVGLWTFLSASKVHARRRDITVTMI